MSDALHEALNRNVELRERAQTAEAERDALREERDIAGTLLANILVTVQPAAHYDQVDLDAIPALVEALVAERDAALERDPHDHCDRDPIECSHEALVGEYREVVAERDRLLGIMTKMTNDGAMVVLTTDGYAEMVAERDRLRAVVDELAAIGSEYKHAVEHVAECGGTCHDCQRLARGALAHENLGDFRADLGLRQRVLDEASGVSRGRGRKGAIKYPESLAAYRVDVVVAAAREWRRWEATALDRSAEHKFHRRAACLALIEALDLLDTTDVMGGEDDDD